MKPILWLLWGAMALFASPLLAQPDEEMLMTTTIPDNLVRNPSFEETENNPVNINYIRSGVLHWKTANKGFTDFFHVENKSPTNGAPKNNFGEEMPHSGKGYGGFCVNHNKNRMQIEYLHSRMFLFLEEGKKYCVSAWVSRAESYEGRVDELGFLFTEREIKVYGKLYLSKVSPQLIFRDSMALANEKGWTRLCGIYEAKGGEEWLTFGCFSPQPGVKAHYFVDDISVVPGESMLDCGCAAEMAEPGQSFALRNVRFEFDQAVLLPESELELGKLRVFLEENVALRIELSGHTDQIGSAEHNLDLSLRRAQAVQLWLEERGISPGRIQCEGHGSKRPLSQDPTPEGRRENRRVEFLIL